ncbi:MAG: hypothetical protein IK081_07815 [Lachnospiraceae bacterium]|nr:hypothetical protein [Lachnospiraceae bacterium]
MREFMNMGGWAILFCVVAIVVMLILGALLFGCLGLSIMLIIIGRKKQKKAPYFIASAICAFISLLTFLGILLYFAIYK